MGESGNDPSNAVVDSQDELAALTHQTGFALAQINNPYDYSRDRRVNSTDELIARNNPTGAVPLQLITASRFAGGGHTQIAIEHLTCPMSLPTGGPYHRCQPGDNLQAAFDSAVAGDVIVLQAGATFTGNFKLPNKTGNDWIYIISSDLSSLPEGQCVGPSAAAHMAKIVTPNCDPALFTDFVRHNYRFAGIEFSTGVFNYNLILMGYGLANYSARSMRNPQPLRFPNFRTTLLSIDVTSIPLPRLWARCGIMADGKYVAIINSRFENFKDGADSQAINIWNGEGPYKFVNNYLEASGENFMSGGTDPAITNAVPADIDLWEITAQSTTPGIPSIRVTGDIGGR